MEREHPGRWRTLLVAVGLAVIAAAALFQLAARRPSPRHANAMNPVAANGLVDARDATDLAPDATRRALPAETDADADAGVEADLRPRRSFTWAEAKEAIRDMAAIWDHNDDKTIESRALNWPLQIGGRERGYPEYDHPKLNPNGKALEELDREILKGIVTEWNALLDSLAKDAAKLADEAMQEYYESERCEIFREGDPIPDRPMIQNARFSRNCVTGTRGWIVRMRFSSDDYPVLDTALAEIDDVKAQRMQAVKDYIAGL